MHIGLVIYGDLGALSGGFLYDRILVEHLRTKGDRVEVFSIPWKSYVANLADNYSKPIRDKLAGFRGDILLQDELNHPSLFLLNKRIRERVGARMIAIVHHLRCSERRAKFINYIYRQIETRFLEQMDGFIFNSAHTRTTVHEVINSGNVKPGVVARPGGDRLALEITTKDIWTRAQTAGPLRIVFLGNIIPRKGLHTLLRALDRLQGENWTLTVIGNTTASPGYYSKQLDYVNKRGWENRVFFTGSLVESSLIHKLRDQHVMAVPSQFEGYGIAYLEGMGLGLPALATLAGGTVELVDDGKTGYLIPPEKPEFLADRLMALIQDRRLLAEMGLQARTAFISHPTWQESMGGIRDFLAAQL